MIAIFLLVSVSLVAYQTYREKNIGNMLAFLVVPYVILVVFNNFFMYRLGFYEISDKVLLMLTLAFIAFFIGINLIFYNKPCLIYERDNEARFRSYDIDKMMILLYAVSAVAFIKLVYLLIRGDITNSEMGSGAVGHLLLICYAVVPIVFLYWTYHKKQVKFLIAVLLIFVMNFATFIKYNIIALIVSTFIFSLIYKKSVLKKACVLLVSVVFFAFCFNYVLDFLMKGVFGQTSIDFYFNHLWVYCSGSLIYDNYVFTTGVNVGMSMFEKLAIFFFALPNMFLSKIFGKRFFPYSIMGFERVGSVEGQASNVTDAFGYIYPSLGGAVDVIAFYVLIFAIGVLFSLIYFNCKKQRYRFSPLMSNFLTFFIFLSFFGTFYVLSGPWEILVWSIIVPLLFLRKPEADFGKTLEKME